MVESTPNQTKANAENSQCKRKNGMNKNLNKAFTQDSEGDSSVRSSRRPRQQSDHKRSWTCVKKYTLFCWPLEGFKQESYMITLQKKKKTLKKRVYKNNSRCSMGNELEGSKN